MIIKIVKKKKKKKPGQGARATAQMNLMGLDRPSKYTSSTNFKTPENLASNHWHSSLTFNIYG